MIFFLEPDSFILSLAITVCFFVTACDNGGSQRTSSGAVKAKDALSTFQIAEGFKIEMIASEPLITSPVDMEIDEYGRLYVVEMPGYPLDKGGSGKIIMLADTDGDGVMDKRTVFKEGLMLPTGIMRWKKGVLVTDSPNILYLEDSDGDGKANITDTLITGFALTNPQHNMNNPVYGINNWIYVANGDAVSTNKYREEFGDEGSEIIFHGQSGTVKLPKNAGGRSIRFQPEQKKIEMLSSSCQFGHTFDEWGHLFECDNSNHGYHEVVANRYFERNPNLFISEATNDMSDHRNAAEVFPTTTNPDRQLLTDVGVITSACGLTNYLGNAFPESYNKNLTFVAEPVSNLVHVDVLRDSGASFIASRVLDHKEFLSSTDAWSRPVNMYIGPDGALYVLDYYRRVIESPEWMSDEAIKAGGLYDGVDMGRIYRITPKDAKPAEWTKGLKLGDASDEELIKMLAHPNAWWRMNAQRLLIDRSHKEDIPALIEMTKNASYLGRLHALWTLEGIGQLQSAQIEQALKDSVAGIRLNGIELAEIHLTTAPGLSKTLLELQNDKDAKVRFQLLLTLGYLNSNEAAKARNKLLFSDINDKWMQIAALTAPPSQTTSLLKEVLNNFRPDLPAYASLLQRLTTMTGRGGEQKDINLLIDEALKFQAKHTQKYAAVLQGLAQGLKTRESPFTVSDEYQQRLVKTFFESLTPEIRDASLQLLHLNGIKDSILKQRSVFQAAAIVNDVTQSPKKRAEAIEFLTLGNVASYIDVLKKMLNPKEEFQIQLSVLKALRTIKDTAVCGYLIQHWEELTPPVRDASFGLFMDDSLDIKLLVHALEKDKIKPSDISFGNSVALMQINDEDLRNRARALFTKNKREADKINMQYQKALTIEGNAKNGNEVYVQNCAICHQVRGQTGVAFGPDLGTIHNWTKEDIMAAVLNPGLSISSGFDMWNVELNNGESVQGIIVQETPAAIVLKNSTSVEKTINRQDIKSLRSLNVSAMPTGLEKKITEQQMADLLAFLRQN